MNKHIEEYLDFYLTLEAPKFAVLIDGKWGSGKTHFIKNYFKENEDHKFLYVSLNGVSSVKGIEDQFYEQLHPFLSSKTSRITGKILKGLLKASLKIDLDGDGSADGSANIQLPDIKLSEELNKAGERILVFDDLERAKMSMKEVLGYINQFVEHDGQRVIVLGSNAILSKEDDIKDIKEKLIGRTFYVKPSFDEAFVEFTKEIKEEENRSLLESNTEIIKAIFIQSETENLRLLRHGFIEFQRLYKVVKEKYEAILMSEELTEDLLSYFFALNFELSSGRIPVEKMKGLTFTIMHDVIDKNETSNVAKLKKRYNRIDFYRPPLENEFWYTYFLFGTIDEKYLKKILSSPKYFKFEEPSWKKLWNLYNISDEKLDKTLTEVKYKFKNQDFDSLGEIIHLFTSLNELSSRGLINKSSKEIANLCVYSVRVLLKKNLFEMDLTNNYFRIRDYNLGHGFTNEDSKEFNDFINRIEKKFERKKRGLILKEAESLTIILQQDVDEFRTLISKYSPKSYHLISILSFIDKARFVELFKEKIPSERDDLLISLLARLRNKDLTKEELVWVQEIISELEILFTLDPKSIESQNLNQRFKLLREELN